MSRCFLSCLLGFKVVRFLRTALKEVSLSVLLGFSEAGTMLIGRLHALEKRQSCLVRFKFLRWRLCQEFHSQI